MEARSVLEKIVTELTTGRIFVVIAKQIVNGDQLVASQPHRFALNEPVADPEEGEPLTAKQKRQLVTDNNAAVLQATDRLLAENGFPPISPKDRATIAQYL
jgi:hypothetical protein